jgi:hypothetical protein
MRTFVGGLIAGAVLCVLAGVNLIGAAIAGLLAAALMRQLGPRSLAEKVGAGMTAALIAWAAGPGSGAGPGFLRYLLGWLAASSALAAYLHPRAE